MRIDHHPLLILRFCYILKISKKVTFKFYLSIKTYSSLINDCTRIERIASALSSISLLYSLCTSFLGR